MTLETLVEKFDLFADAPDAVAKMRELVLQLAVTGKLVTQNQRDEPASVLLKSAEAERTKLVAAKRIKSRLTAPIDPDEQPFELPESWVWARLSDVGYELGQKVPDKRFTYIDVGGIDSDKGRISDRVEKLEPGDAPSRARKLVARGTVIYSTVRPYLLNIAIVEQDFDPEPIASTAFGILHPFEGVNNRYLFYWLRSAPFTAYVQAGMKGMAYPAINDEKFYSGPIALPPLAEQKRIVAKVDELMALCDRLEAQQQERETRHAALARASLARFADAPTPANLQFLFHSSYTIAPDDLRKSILTLAVQGKLVPQDPNDESSEELIRRIAAIRHAEKAKQYDPVTADEAPYEVPFSWSWVRLGSISLMSDSGWSPQCLPEARTGTDWGVLKVSAVSWGVFKPEENKALPPGMTSRPACEVKAGDFLLSRANTEELVARSVVVTEAPPRLMMSDKMVRFTFPEEIERTFIQIANTSEFARAYYARNASGTSSSMKNVSREVMNNLPIPLPPLAEQRRIVAKVDQLMALVDQLETQLAASRATAANLLAALVAELTTQA